MLTDMVTGRYHAGIRVGNLVARDMIAVQISTAPLIAIGGAGARQPPECCKKRSTDSASREAKRAANWASGDAGCSSGLSRPIRTASRFVTACPMAVSNVWQGAKREVTEAADGCGQKSDSLLLTT
jgi:hypothetical protein